MWNAKIHPLLARDFQIIDDIATASKPLMAAFITFSGTSNHKMTSSQECSVQAEQNRSAFLHVAMEIKRGTELLNLSGNQLIFSSG